MLRAKVWFPPGEGCTGAPADALIVEEHAQDTWVSIAVVREGDCMLGYRNRLLLLRVCCEADPLACSGITEGRSTIPFTGCVNTYEMP